MAPTKIGSTSEPHSNLPKGETAEAVRKSLRVMLLASAALMVAWSFAIPVFEGGDEPAHWKYACFLNKNHALPLYGPSYAEANSPPLYYLMIAPLAVDVSLPPNDYTGEEYGRRVLIFPPRVYQNAYADFERYWPFRAARLLTVLISAFTIWFCFLAGTEASGSQWTGLLVAGLVAFWPLFTSRGMNVSNDALVGMLSAIALYLIVRLIKRGFTWRISTLAALAIAGAFLSKATAIFLPGPLLLAIISEKAPWRAKLVRAAVLGAIMLVIVAPWLIRNQLLYGDLLAQKAMSTAVRGLVEKHSLGSQYFLTVFPLVLITSFVGNFGLRGLPLSVWAYLLYTAALTSAALSWVAGVWQRRIDLRLSAILSSIIVLNLMVIVYINLTFTQPQGRYLFPALSAIALLLGLGLESLPTWSKFRTMLTVSGLALSNLFILLVFVIPAYWPPVIK